MFAGTTVVIALGGLFVLGIDFMNGLAVGAAITVKSCDDGINRATPG